MITRKTSTQSRRAQRNQGFTLTEIAIVLGIIGLILGAIWTAAAAVYANQRVAHAETATLQIVQGVRALYSSASSTGLGAATDITPNLVTAGATPSDLGTTDPLNGPFPAGKTMVVGTSDGNGFMVVMSGLTQANCVNLLSDIGGTNRDPGLFNADAVANAAPVAATDASSTGTALTTAVTPTIAASGVLGTPLTSGQGNCVAALDKVRMGFSLK